MKRHPASPPHFSSLSTSHFGVGIFPSGGNISVCVQRRKQETGSTEVVLHMLLYACLHFQPGFLLNVFPKSPPDENQLLSSLTGKQRRQTLHYSPLATASALPAPHFSLLPTVSLSIFLFPEAQAVDKQQ